VSFSFSVISSPCPLYSAFLTFSYSNALKPVLEFHSILDDRYQPRSNLMSNDEQSLSSSIHTPHQAFTALYLFLRDAFQEKGLVRFIARMLHKEKHGLIKQPAAYLQLFFTDSNNAHCRKSIVPT
jgi:hypothetical protein